MKQQCILSKCLQTETQTTQGHLVISWENVTRGLQKPEAHISSPRSSGPVLENSGLTATLQDRVTVNNESNHTYVLRDTGASRLTSQWPGKYTHADNAMRQDSDSWGSSVRGSPGVHLHIHATFPSGLKVFKIKY